MEIVDISQDAFLPSLPTMAEMLPSPLIMTKTVEMARPASARIKHRKPKIHFSPDIIPRYGGKNRLTAPKNTANMANPTTIMSTNAAFFFPSILILHSVVYYAEYIITFHTPLAQI